jgi:hypothetical protein
LYSVGYNEGSGSELQLRTAPNSAGEKNFMNNKRAGKVKRQLGIWGTMTSCIALGAAAWSLGAAQPIKDAQTYSCTDSCYFNYRWCLMQGGNSLTCATQYQNCNLSCTFGSAAARDGAS